MTDAQLTHDQIATAQLEDWRFISQALHSRFLTGDFASGLRLANAIGEAAEAAGHHPELDLRYPHLNVRVWTHDAWGVTDLDVSLARRISELAAELGVASAPSSVSVLELALDTPDFSTIKPFWLAALGYQPNPTSDDEVRNDDGDLPTIWFQGSDSDEPRQRFHLDIRVPKEVARQRIDEAVAAGGTVVDEATSFVVLADADGNRMCVCF